MSSTEDDLIAAVVLRRQRRRDRRTLAGSAGGMMFASGLILIGLSKFVTPPAGAPAAEVHRLHTVTSIAGSFGLPMAIVGFLLLIVFACYLISSLDTPELELGAVLRKDTTGSARELEAQHDRLATAISNLERKGRAPGRSRSILRRHQ